MEEERENEKKVFDCGTYLYENEIGGTVIKIIRTTPKTMWYFIGKYIGSFCGDGDNVEWLVPDYLLHEKGGLQKRNREKITHGCDTYFPDKATFNT